MLIATSSMRLFSNKMLIIGTDQKYPCKIQKQKIQKLVLRVSSEFPNTRKLMKVRGPQPRSQALSPFPPLSSRRETLVAAGHVSMYTNQSRTRGGSSTKFFNRTIQFCLGEGEQ